MNSSEELLNDPAICSFATLSELYRTLSQQNQAPDLDQLISMAPHLESEIRSQFPIIKMLDKALSPAQARDFQLPRVVAGCLLENEIGRGGMGIVYRGHQTDMGRDVAVKVIRLTDERADHSKRFELERHAMARLEHPNIVPAYSFTQDQEYAYLVMKLIDGYGLNQLITEQADYKAQVQWRQLTSDWAAFASCMAEVAAALQHAHGHKVIHRDIKPSNLLLDQSGKIWLSDFGLAKANDLGISRTGDVVGTPKYMAPEQVQGICDARTDIYSFGLTLYELVCGQAARADTDKLSRSSVPNLVPVRYLNPDVPQDLADVIMKACQFQPEQRFQTAQELSVVLKRFAVGQKADRRSEKRPTDEVHRERTRRNTIWASVAVAAMLLFGVVFFAWTQWRPDPVAEARKAPKVNFLDLLSDTEKMDERMGEALRKTVAHATEELQLPEEEKNKLVGEINVLYDQMKNGEIRNRELGALIDNYRDSNLAVATRIWRVIPVIHQLKFSEREKKRADEILRRFAYLSTKERITSADSSRLINSLTDGQSLDSVQFAQWKFTRQGVIDWLRLIDKATENLMLPGEVPSVANEIAAVFSTQDSSYQVPAEQVIRQFENHPDAQQLIQQYRERLDGN